MNILTYNFCILWINLIFLHNKLTYLIGNHFHLSGLHVDFIEHRNNFKPVVNSHLEIGNSLRLHTLGRIYNKQCSLT